MAKIILSLGDRPLQEIPLTKERVNIGRRPHNDIIIDDLAISGEHAVIVTMNHDSFLEDLNSTNGTQVNGQPVKKHYLRDGDCIELAQYRIRYIAGTTGVWNGLASSVLQQRQCDGQNSVARIKVMNGAKAGTEVPLNKAITTIGKRDAQVAVILQQPDGFYLVHVDGSKYSHLNGMVTGGVPRKLKDGDLIDLSGDQVQVLLK